MYVFIHSPERGIMLITKFHVVSAIWLLVAAIACAGSALSALDDCQPAGTHGACSRH
jgi:hypothetical protein